MHATDFGRTLIIANPAAQSGAAHEVAERLQRFLDMTARASQFDLVLTERMGHAKELAAQVEGYRTVIALGGDGVIHEVVNGLMTQEEDTRPALAILPVGSGNDFAQTLGIQKHLLDPYKSFTEAEDRLIDAGKFGDGYFSYVASFGLFTKCSYATPRTMKRLLGHFAYVLEGMKGLHALDATPLTVTADGKFFEGAYIFGAFSNSLSIGGMLKYDENSVDMNDGKLEMLLIRKPETLPDLHRLILALKNNDFSDKHIDFASASTFRLHAAAGFDWSIDGEYAAGGIDTVIRCVKDAVCIAAPRVENG